MLCKSCGRCVPEGTVQCSYCGCPIPAEPAPKIRTHLTEAILVTIFLWAPFGIVAIVHAAQTAALLRRGDAELARRASRRAFMWVKIGIWVGAGFYILLFLFILSYIRLM